jgi:hypothetical protein
VRLRKPTEQPESEKKKKEKRRKEKKATAPDVVKRQEGNPIKEGARESVRTVGGQ